MAEEISCDLRNQVTPKLKVFDLLPETPQKKQVQGLINCLADSAARKLGTNRRSFLSTACGMATTFLAMNEVYGPIFDVVPAEAAEPDLSLERKQGLAKQFILDKVHFAPDPNRGVLELVKYAADHWYSPMKDTVREMGSNFVRFESFLKEIYLDSDTSIGLLSSILLNGHQTIENNEIKEAVQRVNSGANGTRILSNLSIMPGQPGWLDEVDRCIDILRPTSWMGDPIGYLARDSKTQWRLDDEKLMYPFYEKIVKSGITTVCVNKGLMPRDYRSSLPDVWKYATVEDVPKAAKDWPEVSFVICHAAQQALIVDPQRSNIEFERTGNIPWVSDLAAIPEKFGVRNVYGELSTAFAVSAVADPRFCAAMLGTLIKGLGYDHVFWGTGSVFTGSPQWQIEAFRRIDIPEDMRKRHGFAPLGPADGPIKGAIFGENAAHHYRLEHIQSGSAPK